MAKSSPHANRDRRDAGRDRRASRDETARSSGMLAVIRHDILAVLRSKSVRETVESVVIAFALAFLFRTFEAEAFVIPTGSMAPTLQGRHQTVDCPMCGHSYRISASQEIDQETERHIADVVSGTCPNCRYSACTNLELGRDAVDYVDLIPFNIDALRDGTNCASRNGDRILVNKFAYELGEPKRWDIFVFRYPGQTAKNYIKRLVGLPNETVKIYRGNLHVGPYNPLARDRPNCVTYEIERKSPDKIQAMSQLVYDNDQQAPALAESDWPKRWTSWPRGETPVAGGWVADDDHQTFATEGTAEGEVWMRYQHIVPSWDDWNAILDPADHARPRPAPQLVSDMCAYNTSVAYRFAIDAQGRRRYDYRNPRPTDPLARGIHWVGDLTLECEMAVGEGAGEAIVELVEGGVRFQCRFDVVTGQATLSIDGEGQGFVDPEGQPVKQPVAQTSVIAGGAYDIAMANVDDQMVVWVDGEVIQFDAPTTYGERHNGIPTADGPMEGDLAPAAFGSHGATIQVSHLRLSRDVYYIATDQTRVGMDFLTDPLVGPGITLGRSSLWQDRNRFLSTPSEWPSAFGAMNAVAFPLAADANDRQKDQFFAMGDNSPQSKDGRLWGTRTLGFYVERELLIGKAVMIYWPPTHLRFVR